MTAKNVVFEISPGPKHVEKSKKVEDDIVPILRFTQFTHNPKVSFDNVKLGFSKERKLSILNPKDQAQEVICERFPIEETIFSIEPKRLFLSPAETKQVIITWKPSEVGNIRELIHWRSNLGVRAQTVLLGTCIEPSSNKKTGRHRKPLGSHNVVANRKFEKYKIGKESLKENSRFRSENRENERPQITENISRPENVYKENEISTMAISSLTKFDSDYVLSEDVSNIYKRNDTSYLENDCSRRETYVNKDILQDESNVYSSHTFYIDACSSPIRRQTFIKTPDRACKERIKHQIFAERNNYQDALINDSKAEVFVNSEKDFLSCDVEASPLRRQTYIKCSRKSSLVSNKEWPTEDYDESCQPKELIHDLIDNDAITMTPTLIQSDKRCVTPKTPGNLDLTTYCMKFMSKFDGVDIPVNIDVEENSDCSQFYSMQDNKSSDAQASLCEKKFSPSSSYGSEFSTDELMYTAPTSPAFITAPTTPVEFADEADFVKEVVDCDVTQEFPTPKIGVTERLISFADAFDVQTSLRHYDDETILEEYNVQTPLQKFIGQQYDLQTASQEDKTINNSEECNTTLTEKYLQQFDDDNLCTDRDRLSNGTVIVETSTLHPDDIVNIDELDNIRMTTNIGDISASDRNRLNSVPRDHSASFNVPIEKDSVFINESLVHITPFNQTVCPQQNLSLSNPPNSLITHCFTRDNLGSLASLSDFSFHPSNDPKRCSTVVKSQANSRIKLQNADVKVKKLFSSELSLNDEVYPPPNVQLNLLDEEENKDTIIQSEHDRSPELDTEQKSSCEKQSLTFIPISPPQIIKSRNRVNPRSAVKVSVSTIRKSCRTSPIKKFKKPAIPSLRRTNKNYSDIKITSVENSLTTLPTEKKQKSLKAETNFKKRRSTSSFLDSSVKDIRRPGIRKRNMMLPQSRLMLHKSLNSVAIHHPNPYAAKNMYYDDRWLEKQTSGFTKWLNFILTPPEEENTLDSKKVDIGKLWMEASRCEGTKKAPSREAMSLNAYTARKRLGQLRRAACSLYQSKEVATVITKVEIAIEKKILVIRKDRQTHVDMGLKMEMLKLVLSYNSLWLRIGLETVFGEILPLTSNNDIKGLTFFIINRFINCPDIGEAFAHPTVPHYYKPGFEDALKTFQLKKFILLVYFLDKAKRSRLIDHDPCLFNRDSEFKSSRDILLAFSREFLTGVGDITKHLGYMGYTVSHIQTHLDEFDYSVTNIATDLRCGIRLTRVAETMTQNMNLSSQLRLPAISRLQKVHNVEVALGAFENGGIKDLKSKFPVKDIVDGHKETTLGLLWELVFSLQIKNILSEDNLLEEICYLRKSLIVKSTFDERAKKGVKIIFEDRLINERIGEEDSSTESILQQLKLWAQLVCAHYGIEVDNMTVSFCDGRAFCFLLHHYHSDLLKENEIKVNTVQNIPSAKPDFDSSSEEEFSESFYFDNEEIKSRIQNERANFALFISKLTELGAIPVLIQAKDMINTIPDEKVTTTFLAYLCARLLNLSKEIKAARIIQLAWRKILAVKKLKLIQVQNKATSVIQTWWRKYLARKLAAAYNNAAIVLQSYWRVRQAKMLLTRLKLQKETRIQIAAAHVIQKYLRRYLRKKRYMQRKMEEEAANKICSFMKTVKIRNEFMRKRNAASIIQEYWRNYLETRFSREEYLELKLVTIIIQSYYRAYRQRVKYQAIREATLKIQSHFRAHRQRVKYQAIREAAVKIQSHFRGHRLRVKYQAIREATVKIQSYFRGHKQRVEYQAIREATVKIQSHYKGHRQRVKYQAIREATVKIQSHIRGHRQRVNYQAIREATVKIQSYFRGHKQRVEYQAIREATVKIQSHYKGHRQRVKYQVIREATVKIQSHIRGHRQRVNYQAIRKATVKIQCNFRGYKQRIEYLAIREATVKIQSHFRGQRQRVEYQANRESIVKIQSHLRGHRQRVRYQAIREATVKIQSHFRGHRQRVKYQAIREATVKIQSHFRGHRQRVKYQAIRKATMKIQSHFRGHRQRVNYQAIREATVKIQSHFRGHKQRVNYQAIRKATVLIQSHLRGHMLRVRYQTIREATVKIQSHFRGHKQRVNYQAIMKAIVKIQSHFRGHKQRVEYQAIREATVKIQSHFRGHRQRIKYQAIREATVKIQSHFREHRQRIKYQAIRVATVKIQSHFRGHMQRIEYLAIREATVKIQSHFRGHRQRVEYQANRESIVKIQSHFRGHRQRVRYQAIREATVKIQSHFRGHRQRVKYQAIREATVKIQSHFRGHRQRIEYLAIREATVKIQSHFRGHKQRVRYQAIRDATVKIQSHFRGHRQRVEYQAIREATVKIQSHYKGHRQRVKYQAIREATVKIQSHFRGHRQRVRYQAIREATVKIQSHFRGHRQRVKYQAIREATVKIQSHFRGHRQRVNYQAITEATVKIQSHFRGHKQRVNYQAIREATVKIQSHFRGHKQRVNYQANRKAIVKIQSHFRGHKQRVEYQAIREATVKIQSHFRGHRQRIKYQAIREATVKIQSHFRGHRQRIKYQAIRVATVKIQSHFRGHRQRIEYLAIREATVKIQSHFRGHRQRVRYQAIRDATVKIQSHFRAYKQRVKYQAIREATVKIQSHFRGYKQRVEYQAIREATVKIQSHFRAYKQRVKYQAIREATVKIQSHFRGYKQRVEYQENTEAIVKIQSHFRGYKQRVEYQAIREATVKIQSHFRAYKQRVKYQAIREATVKIQSHFRGYKQRVEYQANTEAIVKIQSHFRGYKQRVEYQTIREATVKIQSHFRGHKQRVEYQTIREATVKIQSHFRGHRQRVKYQAIREAIVKIQSHFRGYKQRVKYQTIREATVKIQSHFRGYKQRVEYQAIREATVKIQSYYRAYTRSVKYQTIKNATLKIQSYYRGHKQRVMYKEIKDAAAKILYNYRRYKERVKYQERKIFASNSQSDCGLSSEFNTLKLSAVKIQSYWRMYKQKIEFQRFKQIETKKRLQLLEHKAATKIQSVFRGYSQRKKMLKNRRMTLIRGRLEDANSKAHNDNLIGNRTEIAINYLMKFKDLKMTIIAVISLDAGTKWSPSCCERLVSHKAHINVINLINSCNRSVPHIEILGHSLNVLINISKCPTTLHRILMIEDIVDTIIKLMKIHYEKAPLILNRSCTILYIFLSLEPPCHVLFRSDLKDNLKQLASIIERKASFKKTVNNQNVKRVLPPTMCPTLSPHWAMRPKEIVEFSQPLPAITTLLAKLQELSN